jgi:hypothetical protein
VAFCLAFWNSRADHLDGRQHVRSAMDDPDRGRSESEKNDADDAFDIYFYVRDFSSRTYYLLAGQQCSFDRATVVDQSQREVAVSEVSVWITWKPKAIPLTRPSKTR